MTRDPRTRSGRTRRIVGVLLGIGALVAAVVGGYLVVAYAWGVVDVLDEADQSWIFWGLALLFAGMTTLVLGAILGAASWVLLRRPPDEGGS